MLEGKKNTLMSARTATAILVMGILAASTSSIFIRFAQERVPSLVIATYRLAIASIILWPWAITRYRDEIAKLDRVAWVRICFSGIFLGAHFGTWISSLEYTSVTSSVVLVQTTPLFVLLLSPIFLKESSRVWTYIGLMFAIIGSFGIALSDTCSDVLDPACLQTITTLEPGMLKGDLLALAGAVSGAIYLMIGRAVRKTMSLIPYITLIYTAASLTLLLSSISTRQSMFGYPSTMFIWLFLLAIFPQLFAHSSYNWVLRYLPASSVSLSLLGEPVAAAALAYMILGEAIPTVRWISGLIVLIGIGIAFYRPNSTLQGNPKVDTMEA